MAWTRCPLRAMLGARFLERRGAASADGDVGTGRGELQRDGAADAAAAAGDEDALAGEIEGHRHLSERSGFPRR